MYVRMLRRCLYYVVGSEDKTYAIYTYGTN